LQAQKEEKKKSKFDKSKASFGVCHIYASFNDTFVVRILSSS
jgi:ribosomal protein S11